MIPPVKVSSQSRVVITHLALVEDNTRSDHQSIAAASTVTEASNWIFKKENNEPLNQATRCFSAGQEWWAIQESNL